MSSRPVVVRDDVKIGIERALRLLIHDSEDLVYRVVP